MTVPSRQRGTTAPAGQEIRVVHVPTGEVVFRKETTFRIEVSDEP